jgi:hypothetical protein
MSNFEKMTVVQLKAYATDNNIDLNGLKTKTQIVAAISDIKANISLAPETTDAIKSNETPKEKRSPSAATKSDNNGVVTTRTADQFKDKVFSKTPTISNEKVAIHSDKNMAWMGIGRITRGYNIVTKGASEKWLTRKGIREATPEEVATYYGL